jgi:hypothetical protein
MTNLTLQSVKVAIPFKAGSLPDVDPADPRITIDLGGVVIHAQINAKAARKLEAHTGGAVLQGRLLVEDGRLSLVEAGFQMLDPRPDDEACRPSGSPPTTKGPSPSPGPEAQGKGALGQQQGGRPSEPSPLPNPPGMPTTKGASSPHGVASRAGWYGGPAPRARGTPREPIYVRLDVRREGS